MPTIVVVGAGVSGLSTALLLAKSKANTITIVAKHMPGDYDIEYASPWAGANFQPMSTRETSRWESRTWPELKRITEEIPEAGIHFQNSQVMRRNKDVPKENFSSDPLFHPNPWYQQIFPTSYRELSPQELLPNHDSGCEFTSLCINTAIYLPWLLGQCIRSGITIRRRTISHISQAKHMSHTGLPADFIINTTGLGSLHLGGVQDGKLMPARGQIMLVSNEIEGMTTSSGSEDGPMEVMYIMQRAAGGGTILGGTYELNNREANPDLNTAVRIMKRVVEARPEIAGGKGIAGLDIIRHAVGLRPYRKGGVRVEEEKMKNEDDGETWIVHNYGHSGWGYQGSWGCAEGVVELVNKIRREKGEDLSHEPKLFSWE